MKKIKIFDDEGPIDIRVIEEFEKDIGYEFPSEYKELVSNHDAACPEECMFQYVYRNQKMESDISFCGYGDVENSESIINIQQEEYGHEHIIIFGVSSNGDYIGFDFYASSYPAVVLLLHDVFDDDDKMVVVSLAKNYNDFVASLKQEA